jgi:hypothetical protein
MASRIGIWGETRRFAGALPLGMAVLILALAVIALGACGGGDDDGEGDVSVTELSSTLPTAGELRLDEAPPGPPAHGESEWDDATDLFNRVDRLVIGAATDPSEVGAAIEDAGFQRAVGRDFGSRDLNVRVRAAQFDSEEGALEARDLLHDEDLKSPCPKACIVTPIEYELGDVPDSVAVHHVPNPAIVPPGESGVEAHHAEFAIGPLLYVVQMDGKPSPTFSAEFDKLMRAVYGAASGAE